MKTAWIMLVAGLAAQAALGDSAVPSVATNRITITSHEKRVAVSGLPGSQALPLALWAEEVIGQVEAWLGRPASTRHMLPLAISAAPAPEGEAARVLKAQDVSRDGLLRQEITLWRPDAVDSEELMEAICSLWLSRACAPRRASELAAWTPAFPPDWLAVGVAQQLTVDLRHRNYRAVMAAEREGDVVSAASILRQSRMPSGRWPEKMQAGLVVEWLTDTLTAAALLDVVMAPRYRSKGDLVMYSAVGANDERELNQKWDIWMARQQKRFVPGRDAPDIEAVARIVEMRRVDLGLVHPGLETEQVPVPLLIRHRTEPWAVDVARLVNSRLREATVGFPRDIMRHLEGYLRLFDALASSYVMEPGKKKPRPPRESALLAMWTEADRSWSAYLEQQRRIRGYVDEVARQMEAPVEQREETLREWLDRNEAAP